MSGIAEILLNLGFKVTGSDISSSETTNHLSRRGAEVFIGHKADNIKKADVIVYSSAIDNKNPEIRKAKGMNIPIIPRAEMLAQLMRLKKGIAIAGTHGKTSTSSIIGNIFHQANLKPTTIIGGKVFNIGSNAILGKGDYLICEADESDGSFLKLSPEVVVVTNIDNDHLDYYGNMVNLKKAFIEFINKIPFYGFAVVCID
ncbi:MAG: UDP-N-acetylmuramate--L-alanine ligase, partial [Spirochaetes bacterium]|nr:UDP-N-acetylmuramate--L-alanine ligase [Spirochaetota bacterium]